MLAAPLSLAVVFIGVWMTSRPAVGDGFDAAILKIAAISLGLSAAMVAVNRYAAWAASQLEFKVTQRLVAWGGDMRDMFPSVDRSMAERIGRTLPARIRETADFLEASRQRPSSTTRAVCCAFAAFIQAGAIARLGWHLGEPSPSAVALLAAALALVVFVVTCLDLGVGRRRCLVRPWETTLWARAYQPERRTTVVPATPLLILVLGPYALAGCVWTAPAPWTLKFGVTAGVLTCWDLVWQRREAWSSKGMRLAERVTMPISMVIARALSPVWLLCRCIAWLSGLAALAGLAIYSAAPDGTFGWAGGLGISCLLLYIVLASMILQNWRRPTTVVVARAQEINDNYVTDAVARRIDSLLVRGRFLAVLGMIAAAVATI